MRLAVLIVVFVAFTSWSFFIVATQGVGAIVPLLVREPWAAQFFVDLSIALLVAWSWLRPDAKRHGIPAVPYIIGTIALGSISVLAYLIHREFAARRRAVPQTSVA